MLRPLLVALAALALAPAAHAGGPAMLVGASEDAVKQPTLPAAKAQLDLLRLAGLDTVRVTAIWTPGETEPEPAEADRLATLDAAARLAGVRVIVTVMHFGSRTTPLTDEARAEFAAFAAGLARANPGFREFVVGNEPNLNRFWLPQFGEDGANVAAPAYLQLLARTYDELKAVSPRVRVIGGAVSPRGIDRPNTGRDTHSPTRFIRDLGLAYRASGRTLPVMDEFAFHPYGDSSSQAPSASAHPRTTTIGLADYGKLVALLGEAFDGTAQPGSTLPILYDEYGVESAIPAAKAGLYTGAEPAGTRPVDEATQGRYYREAIAMAFCQPTVRGILLFHTADEPARPAWQSGMYYADGTPKASRAAVQRAAGDSRQGTIARCEGLALPVRATAVWPRGSGLRARPVGFRLTCSLTCLYTARLERVADGKLVAQARGRLVGKAAKRLTVPGRPPAGRYRLRVTATAAVNPGTPATLVSRPLALR